MDYPRKNINGTDPVDIKNLNDNFKYLFMKIFEEVKETPIPTEITTNNVAQPKPLENEIELPDGDITFYATCNVKDTIGNITVKKTSYILKKDGLYNYAGKLILPIDGVNAGSSKPAVTYIKFY